MRLSNSDGFLASSKQLLPQSEDWAVLEKTTCSTFTIPQIHYMKAWKTLISRATMILWIRPEYLAGLSILFYLVIYADCEFSRLEKISKGLQQAESKQNVVKETKGNRDYCYS